MKPKSGPTNRHRLVDCPFLLIDKLPTNVHLVPLPLHFSVAEVICGIIAKMLCAL